MVSPIWRVIALKVAAARFTLLASLCATWLTKQLWATVVEAVMSVKIFTTVELCGFVAPVMSVTVPDAAVKPLDASSAVAPPF